MGDGVDAGFGVVSISSGLCVRQVVLVLCYVILVGAILFCLSVNGLGFLGS